MKNKKWPINQKPGMIDPNRPGEGAKILGILMGSAIAFLIMVLLCSCSDEQRRKTDYEKMAFIVSLKDEIILRDIRKDSTIRIDSARILEMEIGDNDWVNIVLQDDSIGLGTLGFRIIRKVPPDSVLLIRRGRIVWAFWCTHWFGEVLDFKDIDKWKIETHMLRNEDVL